MENLFLHRVSKFLADRVRNVGGVGNISGFSRFFVHIMAKICPIGLKIGLPINLDLIDGQHKNQVHMYKFVSKNTIVWPKIVQLSLWCTDFKWA